MSPPGAGTGDPDELQTETSQADDIHRRLTTEILAVQRDLTANPPDLWVVESQLAAILDGLSRAADSADHDLSLEKRLGPGRFLAIGTLSTLALSVVAGILVHPTALGMAALKFRRLLYFDRSWRPHLIHLYVVLDGVDRAVFEAVHEISVSWVVTNFDGLASRDFSNAYGHPNATVAMIAERLRSEHSSRDIIASMARLVDQRTLRAERDAYWIPF